MTYFYYAQDMSNSIQPRLNYIALNKEVITWLSKNLRKRTTDKKRRYKYIQRNTCVWEHGKNGKRKTYKIGVMIYDEDDALAFKLRWL